MFQTDGLAFTLLDAAEGKQKARSCYKFRDGHVHLLIEPNLQGMKWRKKETWLWQFRVVLSFILFKRLTLNNEAKIC